MTRLSDEQVHRHASPDPGPPEVAERRESAAGPSTCWRPCPRTSGRSSD